MLPKKNRLTKKKDFEKAYQKGRKFFLKSGDVIINIAENDKLDTRAGFLVGKSFSGKAAYRNKMKRTLREVFHQQLKNIKPGFDIVISCKSNNQNKEQINYTEAPRQLMKLLEKSKLLKK
ncbi:ribonuclease P protein component [bacterium BMS3Abin15]|nr:ribonuclease P protein component [bacterium BMS3Abin15]HDK41871.1 ribonuclease P protein component [Candidatus Pacearchaeota archaeon]HDZ85617.1 ribonuclease P protein component [Candidatus Moranbacteria bacterium]